MSSLFVIGATGYIGGSILVGYKEAFPSISSITALVRSDGDFPSVERLGVRVIKGTHSDHDTITEAASQADIVLNAGDADDLPLTNAILAGLKKRSAEGKRRPILIHTSGTGVVADKAEGEDLETSSKIWNDNSEDDIRSIDKDQPHRNVDLLVFGADSEGYVSAYIIAPSLIYGRGTGPKHIISQQIPGQVRVSIQKKETVYVGKGTNQWSNVHIKDLVGLYTLVLKHALSGSDKNGSYGKFYFGSVGQHTFGEIAKRLAPILYAKGLVKNDKAVSVSLSAEPNLKWIANNSKSRADRGFALGWKPVQASLEDTLEEDVSAIAAGFT